MPRRLLIVAVASAAATVIVAPVGISGGPPSLSNSGQLLPLSQAVKEALRRQHRSTSVYLLAARVGVNVYRLGNSGRCFGSGRAISVSLITAAQVPAVFGNVKCSERGAVTDLSSFAAERSSPMRLTLLRGVAADNVKWIELLAADGSVLGTVNVVRNVYVLYPVPKGVTRLRAIDSKGRTVARIP